MQIDKTNIKEPNPIQKNPPVQNIKGRRADKEEPTRTTSGIPDRPQCTKKTRCYGAAQSKIAIYNLCVGTGRATPVGTIDIQTKTETPVHKKSNKRILKPGFQPEHRHDKATHIGIAILCCRGYWQPMVGRGGTSS